jgi:hypothetical protein
MDSNLTGNWKLVLLLDLDHEVAELAKRCGGGQAASVAGFLLVFFRAFVIAQRVVSIRPVASTDSGWQKVEMNGLQRAIAGCSGSKRLPACIAVARKA